MAAVSLLVNFVFNAFWVRVLMGLLRSLVLFTLLKPTLLALIPVAILLSVIAASNNLALVIAPSIILAVLIALFAIIGAVAVPLKSPASCIIPFVEVLASGNTMALLEATIFEFKTIATLSTYLLTALVVGNLTMEAASKLISVDLLVVGSFKLILFEREMVSL